MESVSRGWHRRRQPDADEELEHLPASATCVLRALIDGFKGVMREVKLDTLRADAGLRHHKGLPAARDGNRRTGWGRRTRSC